MGIVRRALSVLPARSSTAATNIVSLTKSTCSHHYRILREAGLIASERKGTELTSRVRAEELQARFPGLLQSILRSYEKEVGTVPRRAADGARRKQHFRT